MSKYIIEMPEGVKLGRGFIIPPVFEGIICEALSGAQEVVEVTKSNSFYSHYGKHEIDGKPVKLWATKGEAK